MTLSTFSKKEKERREGKGGRGGEGRGEEEKGADERGGTGGWWTDQRFCLDWGLGEDVTIKWGHNRVLWNDEIVFYSYLATYMLKCVAH